MGKEFDTDVELDDIVPEYYSSNDLVIAMFFKRLNIAAEYCDWVNTKRLLDVGCGAGFFIDVVHKTCPEINQLYGIDTNKYIEKLNFKDYATFSKQDIHDIQFRGGTFDTVACLDVLEHFRSIDKPVKELKRVLKKHGYLIVSGPTESIWYKLARFFIKGRFSEKTGPIAGSHYSNIIEIDRQLTEVYGFKRMSRRQVRFLFMTLFHVNLYKKQ